jgi:hypothetical protein
LAACDRLRVFSRALSFGMVGLLDGLNSSFILRCCDAVCWEFRGKAKRTTPLALSQLTTCVHIGKCSAAPDYSARNTFNP